MIGCLAKAAGMGLVLIGGWIVLAMFGFATLINPEPAEDWWSRYWANFGPMGAVGAGIGAAVALFGGWLVTLAPEVRASVRAAMPPVNWRPDRTRDLAGDPPERTP